MRKLLIITFAVFICSCSNYLDLKPYGKVIPKTAEEYSAMVHYILNQIEYGKPILIVEDENAIVDIEASADNLDANIYLGSDNLPYYIGGLTFTLYNNYSELYARVRDCNIVIAGLAADETPLAKTVTATATAMRGICYYQLLRQFCQPVSAGVYPEDGLQLVDEFDMEARPLRSSYEKTVEFIEQDLLTAMKYNMTDELYMFTADVVKGYLARLYFWTGNYTEAIKYAEPLLTQYPLLKGEAYKNMMTTASKTGNILIKSTVKREDIGAGGGSSTASEYLKYRPVSKQFIDLFDDKANDIRYNMFVSTRRAIIKRPIGGMRSAEFALILAESYYHTKDNTKALQTINNLRANRINNYTELTTGTIPVQSTGLIVKDATGAELTPLITLILNERRKELLLESDRIYELKRNGSPAMWVSRSGLCYRTESYMYTYAIPIKDTELIKGLKQNPGYDEYVNE